MPMARSQSNTARAPARRRLHKLLTTRETRLSYSIVYIGLWSVCFYFFITHFIGGTIEVQGDSMAPTLQNGETRLLNRWSSRVRTPRRGELVVIRDPSTADLAIKRVIAVEGERVEIHDAAVFINGAPLRETYLSSQVRTFPLNGLSNGLVVPKNHFFVLGDNRISSVDSRYYGTVARSKIIGLVAEP